MPNISQHHSTDLVKLLLIGDSKAGKTGSLVSLVEAGYKLRILDLDNLLDTLRYMIEHHCPDQASTVEYRTLRDKYKAGPQGMMIDGSPKAFVDAVKMLDKWKYKDDTGAEVDLGAPAEWGPDCVLVIDSLSRLCDAAYDFHLAMNPKNDGRAIYGDAQDAIESILAGLTSKTFATNVIVIAHVQFLDLPDGTRKGYPQGVGQKLSPKIPQYFPSVVLYTNQGGKRTLQTNSSPLIDLANPKPFAMEKSYPIESGLAKFFGVLRDPPTQTTKPTKLLRKA